MRYGADGGHDSLRNLASHIPSKEWITTTVRTVYQQLKRHCLFTHINDLEISQRNCREEWLERADTLEQGQMKAMKNLERALGRPQRWMPQQGSGNGSLYKKAGMYLSCHLFY